MDGRGNAYVNRVGFDPTAGEEFRPGFVHLVTPDGAVREVADDIAFPNGMAVTPDNGTLIVADSYRHALVAFDIGADGGLANRRVWADLGAGTPDGICVDAEGAVWYADVPNRALRAGRRGRHGAAHRRAGPRRVRLRARRPGGTTLFAVTARWLGMTEAEFVTPGSGQVLAVEVDVPGAGWP